MSSDLESMSCLELYRLLEGGREPGEGCSNEVVSPVRIVAHHLLNWLSPSTRGAPESKEASRILIFYINSLFSPKLEVAGSDGPPLTVDMKSWSVFTPHYKEDCMLSISKLSDNTEDQVDTLDFLRTAYKHEWRNLQERIDFVDSTDALHSTDIEDYVTKVGDFAPFNSKYSKELSVWASNRLQVLSRTVRGMMKYREAIKTLANLEGFGPEKSEMIASRKFRYVVTSQVYNDLKNSDKLDQQWIAESIDMLLREYPEGLVISYVDKHQSQTDSAYYSCAVTGQGRSPSSRYRVKLPGMPILGEGKPENQNHAIIFTRGQYLQVVG